MCIQLRLKSLGVEFELFERVVLFYPPKGVTDRFLFGGHRVPLDASQEDGAAARERSPAFGCNHSGPSRYYTGFYQARKPRVPASFVVLSFA